MDVYNRTSSDEKYSAEDRREGLGNYLADLAKDYRRNKIEIFQIIEDTVNEILPKKVNEYVRKFAEFREFPDNTTVKFKVRNGKIKAVSVALGGSVRRTRLDNGGTFILNTSAIQAKVYEEYERIIGGLVNFNELINMVVDAIMEEILKRVYNALIGIFAKLPNANKHTSATLDKAELDKILNVVKAYGNPIIMGTPVALAQITLDSYASEADKNDIRNKGLLGIYKGCPVVEMPNSFEDTENTIKTFTDKYLFILPSSQERIVKVAMEGGLKTREREMEDWTTEYEAYQKVGVAVLAVNNIGMYEISGLS
jgi:hypothetical protein